MSEASDLYEQFTERYRDLCCGNENALQFLMQWHIYCHGVDDIIDAPKDGRKITSEFILGMFIRANVIYSSQFYRDYAAQLQPVVLLVTNAYADSCNWENDPCWKKAYMADVMRHAGNEMITIVAYICGGWEHMRACSPKIWERSFDDHHHEDGTPK